MSEYVKGDHGYRVYITGRIDNMIGTFELYRPSMFSLCKRLEREALFQMNEYLRRPGKATMTMEAYLLRPSNAKDLKKKTH